MIMWEKKLRLPLPNTHNEEGLDLTTEKEKNEITNQSLNKNYKC